MKDEQYMVLYEDDYNEFRGTHHYTPYGIANDMEGCRKLAVNEGANSGRNRGFKWEYKEWTEQQISEMKAKGELIWDFR